MKPEEMAQISAIVIETLRQHGAAPKAPQDEQVRVSMADLRRTGPEWRGLQWERRVPCRSPLTGSTFVAVVQGWAKLDAEQAQKLGQDGPRDADPLERGRVVRLENYEHDDRTARHFAHNPGDKCDCGLGGAVPARLALTEIVPGSDKPSENMDYSQWKWELWKKDLASYVQGIDELTGETVQHLWRPELAIVES